MARPPQRSPEQQLRAGRPSRPERFRAAVRLLAIAAAAGLVAVILVHQLRDAEVLPECALRYGAARTAADTAVVDAIILSRRDPSQRSCGALRRLHEARQRSARGDSEARRAP